MRDQSSTHTVKEVELPKGARPPEHTRGNEAGIDTYDHVVCIERGYLGTFYVALCAAVYHLAF